MQTQHRHRVHAYAGETPLGSPQDHSSHHDDRLSSETIHNLRLPLTVIKAQAQMLERWVSRNDVAGADGALRRLEVITSMVTRLVDELDELRDPPRDRPGPETSLNGDNRIPD